MSQAGDPTARTVLADTKEMEGRRSEPHETRRHLVLVGLMGAGKSTVGAACAERLDRPFVDTDDQIVLRAAMPFDEIWRTGGEARFRELEREVVADVCASPVPLVIASGGGAIVDVDNRRRFREAGVVVWLRAPTAVLAARVGDGATRPLLAGDPEGALARLGAARQDAYSASADAVVDTEDRAVDDVVDTVLAAFAELAS
jgi:shikimate kinase